MLDDELLEKLGFLLVVAESIELLTMEQPVFHDLSAGVVALTPRTIFIAIQTPEENAPGMPVIESTESPLVQA